MNDELVWSLQGQDQIPVPHPHVEKQKKNLKVDRKQTGRSKGKTKQIKMPKEKYSW